MYSKRYKSDWYVGKTTQTFQQRFSQHREYIKSDNLNEPAGEHFNQPGHSVSDFEGMIIEKVNNTDPFILKEREHFYIQKFDTFYNGLNKER